MPGAAPGALAGILNIAHRILVFRESQLRESQKFQKTAKISDFRCFENLKGFQESQNPESQTRNENLTVFSKISTRNPESQPLSKISN